MKKILLLILLFSLFLVGCNKENESEKKEYGLNILSTTSQIEIKKDWNKDGCVDSKVITNLQELKTLIQDLNNLKLELDEVDDYDFNKAIYYIKCGNKHIYFTDYNTIYVKEDDVNKYIYKTGEIDFIDTMFTNRVYNFTEFEFTGDIVVKNQETSKEAKIQNASEFYQKLNTLKFKKVEEQELKYDFVISIGSKKIYVKEDMFLMEDTYYQVTEGNFDFLKELKYEGSGWLPWV